MHVTITARHFKAPEKLKKFANNELQRLQKFYDGIVDCSIVFDYIASNRSKHRVEIRVNVYGQVLSVSELSEDMYKSVDKAVAKLERQLKRYKAQLRGLPQRKKKRALSTRYPFGEEE